MRRGKILLFSYFAVRVCMSPRSSITATKNNIIKPILLGIAGHVTFPKTLLITKCRLDT